MAREQGLTKNQVVQELARSTHGKLEAFIPVVDQATKFEPEFLAHLIAWNQKNGQIRDSQIGLPLVSLRGWDRKIFPTLRENSLAHLALQSPRDLLRGIRFAKDHKIPGRANELPALVEQYLRHREKHQPLWQAAAVTHQRALKELYALCHIKPAPFAHAILFKRQYPKGSVYYDIANLRHMQDDDAAAAILRWKLPFNTVTGALVGKGISENIVLAMLKHMSPTEVVTNMKMLEKLGVKKSPVLRSALEDALERVGASKKNVLKTGHKAKEVAKVDKELARKMEVAQAKQLDSFRIEGDWVVLGDASSSMQQAIEVSKMLASFLASVVKGKVYLCFFNTLPRLLEVTGKSYEQIQQESQYVRAQGGTSIGCGLEYLRERGILVDGIAVVSDGADNTAPLFATALAQYQRKFGVDLPVCLYWMKCHQPSKYNNDPDRFASMMEAAQMPFQTIDLRDKEVDYYSLPNLVATMQTKRYGLIDAIMDTPLLTRAQVFAH